MRMKKWIAIAISFVFLFGHISYSTASAQDAGYCSVDVEMLTPATDCAKGVPISLNIDCTMWGYIFVGTEIYVGDTMVYNIPTLSESDCEAIIPYSVWKDAVKIVESPYLYYTLSYTVTLRCIDPVFGEVTAEAGSTIGWSSDTWPVEDPSLGQFGSVIIFGRRSENSPDAQENDIYDLPNEINLDALEASMDINPGAGSWNVSLDTKDRIEIKPVYIRSNVLFSDPAGNKQDYTYRWFLQTSDVLNHSTRLIESETHDPSAQYYLNQDGNYFIYAYVTEKATGITKKAVSGQIQVRDVSERILWDPKQEQENIDLYYTTLMADINNGKDPMKNKAIVEMIETRLHDHNFNDENIKTVTDTLKKAPKTYKELYLLSFYNYTMVGGVDEGCYYDCPPNGIVINKDMTTGQYRTVYKDVFFHESGHAAQLNLYDWDHYTTSETMKYGDWKKPAAKAGNTAIEEAIFEKLQEDVSDRLTKQIEKNMKNMSNTDKNYILSAFLDENDTLVEVKTGLLTSSKYPSSIKDNEELRHYYDIIKEQAVKEVKDAGGAEFNNALMGSDITLGVTNLKVDPGLGHYKDYWIKGTVDGKYAQNGNIMFEAWAEYYSAMITNDKKAINSNRKLFPKATVELENLAKELHQDYQDYYTELYGSH